MQSYRFEFAVQDDRTPTAYFHEPRGWETSMAYAIERDRTPELSAARELVARLGGELKAAGVKKIDGRFQVEGEEGSVLIDHVTITLADYARALEDVGRGAQRMDLAKAAVHIRRIDALPDGLEWPRLERSGGIGQVEARVAVLEEFSTQDLHRLVEKFRILQRSGLAGLTEAERDELKKPSPSEQA